MSKNKLYFIFSSITFLQLYIPIVIESNKRGFENYFIIRKNGKSYADPYTHKNIIRDFSEKYNIKLLNSSIKEFPTGIYFLVDGDIYGPPRDEVLNQSLIFKIRDNKNNIIINLNENMNFIDKYDIIQEYCDYCFFESNQLINFWNNIDEINYSRRNMRPYNGNKYVKIHYSIKNIYGINTKFDNKYDGDIYKKFNLNKDDKYCLFLYPKLVSYTDNDILNIYSHLRKLGFKIIVKTRPKSSHLLFKNELKGDYYIESDIYPNETLSLLSISDLCIFSSSSAQSECLYNMVPCLDLESDIRQKWAGFEFLLDNKFYKQIINSEWKGIEYSKFSEIIYKLEKKGSKYIQDLKNEYFKIRNSSEFILNFIERFKMLNK
jgi:hypothetical protein